MNDHSQSRHRRRGVRRHPNVEGEDRQLLEMIVANNDEALVRSWRTAAQTGRDSATTEAFANGAAALSHGEYAAIAQRSPAKAGAAFSFLLNEKSSKKK